MNDGATEAWDADQEVPYADQGNKWVGYDNVKSFHIKVKSVPWVFWEPNPGLQEIKWLLSSILKQAERLEQNNLGGALLWTLNLDDFTGAFCNQGQFPLTSALKNALRVHSQST